jgi:hypothetical protein
LLLVDMDVLAFTLVCGRAKWLGREELGREKAVRLHRTPVDWLESGCRGVVHVEPISRRALRDLRLADEIRCSNIHTALEAWSWGFGDDDDELGRFVIDDSPENIRSYFAQIAKFQALAKLQQSDLWPRSTAGTR